MINIIETAKNMISLVISCLFVDRNKLYSSNHAIFIIVFSEKVSRCQGISPIQCYSIYLLKLDKIEKM